MIPRRYFLQTSLAVSGVLMTAPLQASARTAAYTYSAAVMSQQLVRSDFAPHTDTSFKVVSDQGVLTLTLRSIEDLGREASDASSSEHQFSLLFEGPEAPVLQQQTCRLKHAEMGELALFLVPVQGGGAKQRYYEAIFNRRV
ncbi:DUF6916 family protein [Salisaeta longa]|uniref:DUF6916 family protein n=1 Tax=Salisaeta longa TaxID=503170 RepID=UPI0003B69B21|nr:hypothetical protein [Salisaeta longa]